MPDATLASVVPSLLLLGIVAVAAAVLALVRRYDGGRHAERVAAARVLAITTGVQAMHFGEEWATGFHEQFPALAGLPPMPLWFFLGFNSVWLLLWLIAIPGIRSGRTIACFAAWFLALAAVLNGVAHPLMALSVGGYFPGLYTSPFIGIAGIWLSRQLGRATESTSHANA